MVRSDRSQADACAWCGKATPIARSHCDASVCAQCLKKVLGPASTPPRRDSETDLPHLPEIDIISPRSTKDPRLRTTRAWNSSLEVSDTPDEPIRAILEAVRSLRAPLIQRRRRDRTKAVAIGSGDPKPKATREWVRVGT